MCAKRLPNKRAFMRSWMRCGYSKKLAKAYAKALSLSRLSKDRADWSPDGRYLLSSIEKYGSDYKSYISDLDYMFLYPLNNSFSKWLRDLVTVNKILVNYRSRLPKLWLSVIEREHSNIYLPIDTENGQADKVGFERFAEHFDEHPRLALRPTYNHSYRKSYIIERVGEDRYTLCYEYLGLPEPEDKAVLDGKLLAAFMDTVKYDCVVAEPYKLRAGVRGTIRVYAANHGLSKTEILDAYVIPYDGDAWQRIEEGEAPVADWEQIKAELTEMFSFVDQVQYLSADVVLTEDGFVVDRFRAGPRLPSVPHGKKLNDYLTDRLIEKQQRVEAREVNHYKRFRHRCYLFYVRHFCRPGIRPYMQRLWMRSVWDDLLHTESVGLFKKLWCHRHGFLSFRIWQYGLTKKNYKDFLSDYQYHWLNRINNGYQIWLNDKLTTRYVMEPKKQYLAKYYFVIAKRQGETCIRTLQDIPEGYSASFDEIFRLLRSEGLLALKPSSGTHGDGFYRMEYADGKYLINGSEQTTEEIVEMIAGFKSIYIITEYLFMHHELRKIYPHSVNTIRVAVVNQHGNEPKIMQTYMRIGSSKSGYTDNVGYGGICAKIDIDTGRYHSPEQIYKHRFTPCPEHPDTGVRVEGVVPNWEYMKEGVKGICRFMPELEYLGFDIAITDDGFKVIEINIHQDLHKVAEHSQEFKDFYRDKLQLKAERYNLKKW